MQTTTALPCNVHDVTSIVENLRPGDHLFLDIDETVLFTGIEKYRDVTVCIEKNLAAAIAYAKSLHNVRIVGLTARSRSYCEQTKAQLVTHQIELDDIIHAPNDKAIQKVINKGTALVAYLDALPSKPKRVVVIDDKQYYLDDIFEKWPKASTMRLVLYHYQPIHRLSFDNDQDHFFPNNLSGITSVSSLGGSTHSTYQVTLRDGRHFVLKYGVHSEAMQMEILCNAICQLLGVPVPRFEVYTQVPKKMLQALQLRHQPGIYQLSEYIENSPHPVNDEAMINSMRQYMGAVIFFIGNLDLHVNNFIYDDRTKRMMLSDGGSNSIFRACGEKQSHPSQVEPLETYYVREGSLLNMWLQSLSVDDLRLQMIELTRKRKHIEALIHVVAKKLQMSAALHHQILAVFSDRLDKLTTHYCPEEQPYAKWDKRGVANETAGGALIYTKKLDVLLAQRCKHRWWGNLGGKSEDKKNEDGELLIDGVIREVSEESSQQIQLSYYDLSVSPSHDLLTISQRRHHVYRMFLICHPHIDCKNFTDKEHLAYEWVPLRAILDAIEKKAWVNEEGQQTIQVGDKIIHPPLFHMLMQKSVKENLERLLKNEKLIIQHTQSKLDQAETLPLTSIYAHPMHSAYADRFEMSGHLLRYANIHRHLMHELEKNKKLNVSRLRAFSPSEMHLKMVLGDQFKDKDPKANIRSIIQMSDADNYHMTESQLEKFINQCMRFIRIEKENPNNLYSYHATNDTGAFVYAVFASLYQILQGNQNWPVFRANAAYFAKFKHLRDFIDCYARNGRINNNDTDYHNCVLSANLFLFGNHLQPSSHSIDYLMKNRTRRTLHPRELIQALLDPYKIQRHLLEKLFSLQTAFEQAYGATLYQIGIPKENAYDYLYPAGHLGVMNKLGNEDNVASILDALSQQPADSEAATRMRDYVIDLQVRAFLPPHLKLSVNKMTRQFIFSPLSVIKMKNKQAALKEALSCVVQQIVYSILIHYFDAERQTLSNQTLLFSLLPHWHDVYSLSYAKTSQLYLLVDAIFNGDVEKIRKIFSQEPALKNKKISCNRYAYLEYAQSTQIIDMLPIDVMLNFSQTCTRELCSIFGDAEIVTYLSEKRKMKCTLPPNLQYIFIKNNLDKISNLILAHHFFDASSEYSSQYAALIHIKHIKLKVLFEHAVWHDNRMIGRLLMRFLHGICDEDQQAMSDDVISFQALKYNFIQKNLEKITDSMLIHIYFEAPLQYSPHYAELIKKRKIDQKTITVVVHNLSERCACHYNAPLHQKIDRLMGEVASEKRFMLAIAWLDDIVTMSHLTCIMRYLQKDQIYYVYLKNHLICSYEDLRSILKLLPDHKDCLELIALHQEKIKSADDLLHIIKYIDRSQRAFLIEMYGKLIINYRHIIEFVYRIDGTEKKAFLRKHWHKIKYGDDFSLILELDAYSSAYHCYDTFEWKTIITTIPLVVKFIQALHELCILFVNALSREDEITLLNFAVYFYELINDGYQLSKILVCLAQQDRLQFADFNRVVIQDIKQLRCVLKTLTDSEQSLFVANNAVELLSPKESAASKVRSYHQHRFFIDHAIVKNTENTRAAAPKRCVLL